MLRPAPTPLIKGLAGASLAAGIGGLSQHSLSELRRYRNIESRLMADEVPALNLKRLAALVRALQIWLQLTLRNKRIGPISELDSIENTPDRCAERTGLVFTFNGSDTHNRTRFCHQLPGRVMGLENDAVSVVEFHYSQSRVQQRLPDSLPLLPAPKHRRQRNQRQPAHKQQQHQPQQHPNIFPRSREFLPHQQAP